MGDPAWQAQISPTAAVAAGIFGCPAKKNTNLYRKNSVTVQRFPADNDRTKTPLKTSSIYAGLTASRWNLQ